MGFINTLGLFLALLLLGGCVSQSSYQLKLDENELFARSMIKLEADYDRLDKANEVLAGRNEELAASLAESMGKRSNLQKDLVRARADIERVEKVLSARSLEAGEAMSEMRRTIDRLEDSIRALETEKVAVEDKMIRLGGERRLLEERNQELTGKVEQERIARQARIAKMKHTYDQLLEKMENEIERGEVTITELKGKLTVNMVDRILFDSGETEIRPAGLEVLRRVGDILKEVENKGVRVEGHTDNVPISSRLRGTFPTNWELSSARATNVVRFLKKEVGIAGERLSACAFGQYRPVAANDTAKGRTENRRIQIVLVPLETETSDTAI